MELDLRVTASVLAGPGYALLEDQYAATSAVPLTNTTLGLWPTNGTTPLDWPEKTLAEKLLIGILLGFIIICSVAGNSLVCIAVLTQRSMRKSSNFFYVSLACSDLLVSLTVMTFAGINDIRGSWIFGPIFCNIWLSLDVMCCTASILNICAISLDRYLHIRKPYTYNEIMTTCRAVGLIMGIWAVSALISFLPIHLGWHVTPDFDPWVSEDIFVCLLALNPLYAVLSSLVSFYIPCIIMLVMYINMYRLARSHLQSIKATTASYSVEAMEHAYRPSDHKAAITLGVIMGVFLFCWVPFFTVNVITAFVALPDTVFIICTWLGYINSMANPIIYSIFNKEFRNAFKKVLAIENCCVCLSRCLHESNNEPHRKKRPCCCCCMLSAKSSTCCAKRQQRTNGYHSHGDTMRSGEISNGSVSLTTKAVRYGTLSDSEGSPSIAIPLMSSPDNNNTTAL